MPLESFPAPPQNIFTHGLSDREFPRNLVVGLALFCPIAMGADGTAGKACHGWQSGIYGAIALSLTSGVAQLALGA